MRKIRHEFGYFANKIKRRIDWVDSEYVVFVSTGRTGTKFLADYFSQYTTNILSLHEPCEETLPLGVNFYKKKVSLSKAVSIFKKSRYGIQHRLFRENKSILVESDGNLRYLLPVVKEVSPDVKIIYIIRNPYDYVRSFASRSMNRDGINIPRYSLDENWHVLPHEVNDKRVASQWGTLDIIQKGAWNWNFQNKLIINQLGIFNNTLVMRFEDLFDPDNDYQGFSDIVNFIDSGINFNIENIKAPLREKKNESRQFLVADNEQWKDSQRSFLVEVAGDLMREFKYS
jgi:hypothetical protein